MWKNEIAKRWFLFLAEIHREIEEFRTYVYSTKLLRWFTAVWILLLYGIRLFHEDIFIDSDNMLIDPQGYLVVMYGSHRFGMVLIKKVFSFLRLTPTLANLLMMIALWLFILLTGFCFWRLSGNDKYFHRGMIPFSALFLSAPCLAEQFYFVLQAFEIALAMIFSVMGMYCAQMGIRKGQSPIWYLPALVLMVWSMGTYQAFPAFYIALTVLAYLISYQAGEVNIGWREGILNVLLFLAGFLITQFLALFFVWHVQGDTSYVDSMFAWKTQALRDCLFFVAMDFRRVYQAELPLFFSGFFVRVAIIASLLVIWCGWRKRRKNLLCCLFGLFVLFTTPIMITLLTGMAQPIRAHLTFALVFAAYLFLICALLPKLLAKWSHLRLAAYWFTVFFSCSLAWKQMVATNELFETAHEVYVSDNLMANRIYSTVCYVARQENLADCKVVFIGSKGVELAGHPTYGDVIGHSVFQWDATSEVGVSARVCEYFQTLGIPIGRVSASDYEKAMEAGKNKPIWPKSGSVFKLDDLIVVKLSQ